MRPFRTSGSVGGRASNSPVYPTSLRAGRDGFMLPSRPFALERFSMMFEGFLAFRECLENGGLDSM